MTLLSFDPTSTLLRLQESLERLAREPALGVSTFGTPSLTVFPPINVFTDDDALVVRAEVPGFREDDQTRPGRYYLPDVDIFETSWLSSTATLLLACTGHVGAKQDRGLG